ncbi:lasso peptide [Nostoc sp. LEGE 06077]|uniref:lasso peptide n=1 Tax=Nostoc sp. LEGE 06077 TaxID=915325 RepID=UPI001881547A|nr:lasso peptide [Nostoc sp. LEGE 06077]MBE9205422.1 lasso peptide [Nostoc sp. LEGE 06077]
MKKSYEAPKLTNYGSVEDVTHAFGTPGREDTFQVGNQTFPGSSVGRSGSQDGVLVPLPR